MNECPPTDDPKTLERCCVNTIRTLAMDAIQKANSGHPGAPMGLAAVGYVLFTRVLNHNPSYVFFKLEEEGPIGYIQVKLTPERSIALDRKIFPPSALAYIETQKPELDRFGEIYEWRDHRAFVLNQDTGGAIKGPGRADLFWGNGHYAEVAAGHMQHPGTLYFLVLKPGNYED